MGELDEIVEEFLVESTEGLDQFDRDIVALEADPTSAEHLGSAFRIFHTIKGTCGFLGLGKLEELTHGAESLLAKMRDGDLRLNTARTNVLLDVGDTIRSMLAVVEQTGDDGGRDVSNLVNRLEALQLETDVDRSARQPALVAVPASGTSTSESGQPPASGTSTSESGQPPASGTSTSESGQPPAAGESEGMLNRSSAPVGSQQMPEALPASASPPPRVGTPSDHDPSGARERREGRSKAAGLSGPVSERSVRVDVELLDNLMREVGELVLARNEVVSFSDALEGVGLVQPIQRLSLIVSELQEGVMKTRMQPLTQLFSKLPRMVRDLSAMFDKDVVLEVEGGDTELDRSVLEAVRDPFMHLMRNAIDHGIETPAEREAAGKPRAGTLSVRAHHEGGQVIIEVSDDGGGIDTDKVGRKAVQIGVVTAEQLSAMAPRDIMDLIFTPGFSTAEKITSISGRGVGMDVVRSNIASVGGSIEVSSHLGEGTGFRIKIPLTLAIVPALLVECRGQRYAIPQPNLVEMLHIGTQASPATVETIDQAEVMRLRGHLLPLVRLDEVFGLPSLSGRYDERATVAVLQADGLKFGLVIDEVFETQEIVVKPLGEMLKNVEPFAGATILGDGAVALIIDVVGLTMTAGLRDAATRIASSGQDISEPDAEAQKTAFLILRVGENRTIAVPVDQVARLESISQSSVEKSGEVDVIQYRGSLMRLVRLHEVLGVLGHEQTPEIPLKVVVHESEHGPIGFVVADLVDVLEDVVELADVDSGYGLAGAVVLHGRVTDVLDLDTAVLWMQREGLFAEAR